MTESKPLQGLVIATYGRHYQVESADVVYRCVTRGKQSGVACGDRVVFQITSSGQGVIESILPRDNLLHRSVEHRSKLIAANVSLIVIVVAPVPSFYDLLINRCLVAAESDWKTYTAGQQFAVPGNSKFDIETVEMLDYVCHFG